MGLNQSTHKTITANQTKEYFKSINDSDEPFLIINENQNYQFLSKKILKLFHTNKKSFEKTPLLDLVSISHSKDNISKESIIQKINSDLPLSQTGFIELEIEFQNFKKSFFWVHVYNKFCLQILMNQVEHPNFKIIDLGPTMLLIQKDHTTKAVNKQVTTFFDLDSNTSDSSTTDSEAPYKSIKSVEQFLSFYLEFKSEKFQEIQNKIKPILQEIKHAKQNEATKTALNSLEKIQSIFSDSFQKSKLELNEIATRMNLLRQSDFQRDQDLQDRIQKIEGKTQVLMNENKMILQRIIPIKKFVDSLDFSDLLKEKEKEK
ncbi:hypothetical protein M0811_05307 [Anaeramoeba ignava]|uniref:Uncharacterized protein n=1 Tax=Anaeramoeba ignava TaxID=1746090 RepID=A0A9Q0LVH3_ANAIG|nr:hypothetical protein M0811_05307 [Anaeramoeba ignava]